MIDSLGMGTLVQGCGSAGLLNCEFQDGPGLCKRGGDARSLVLYDGTIPWRIPGGLKAVCLEGLDDTQKACHVSLGVTRNIAAKRGKDRLALILFQFGDKTLFIRVRDAEVPVAPDIW